MLRLVRDEALAYTGMTGFDGILTFSTP